MTGGDPTGQPRSECACKCHAYGPGASVSCDVGQPQPGGILSCTTEHGSEETIRLDVAGCCERCGAEEGQRHGWVEGDCILPHRNHSRRLVAGAHVCEPCVERHREWLGEIVELYAGLSAVLFVDSMEDEQTGEYQKKRKAPASPSPLRLAAWALFYNEVNPATIDVSYETGQRVETAHAAYLGGNLPDVPAVLTGWAAQMLDSQAVTVFAAATALKVGAEIVACDPDVDDYDAELGWVRRALRSAHGIANPDPIGPCLNVTCKGRVWPVPGNKPKCDRCQRRYGVHDIVRLHAQQRTAS